MAKKKTKRTRRRRRSRINPMLGLLGLAATAGLANKDAIGKGLGGAKEWISNLFGKKGGDLSQMPFGSDDRIAEYKKRDWAMDKTTHPEKKRTMESKMMMTKTKGTLKKI